MAISNLYYFFVLDIPSHTLIYIKGDHSLGNSEDEEFAGAAYVTI